MAVFIEAARARKEALDHVLFVGPPGLGKDAGADRRARARGELPRHVGAGDRQSRRSRGAPANLEERDVLFIDEIHRLNPVVEEVLYPAMEDFQLDLIIGSGPAARSVKLDLAKFTLVGATTRAGLLTNPLRDRFGIPVRLNFYSVAELEQIVNRGARVLGIGITPDGANEIARRARGTPRIAGRLLRRLRDFAAVAGAASIDRAVADKALAALEVDAAGLDAMDRRYLTTIAVSYGGVRSASRRSPPPCRSRAMPSRTSSSLISFNADCCSAPRGRLITSHAFRHLGLAEPARDPAQFGLFGASEEE